MKMIFNNSKDEDYYDNKRTIVLETDEGILNIQLKHKQFNIYDQAMVDYGNVEYEMNPKQLREFIGALLHFQSKLSKEGGNEIG